MALKVNVSPALVRFSGRADLLEITNFLTTHLAVLYREFVEHARRLNLAVTSDGEEPMTLPLPLASYTVATLPAAASWVHSAIYVSNEIGGATLAFSDGTNWRRVQDRAVVS